MEQRLHQHWEARLASLCFYPTIQASTTMDSNHQALRQHCPRVLLSGLPVSGFQPGHRHIVLGAKMVILSGSAEEFCNCCVHSCSALSALPARHACVNSAASATKPASRRLHSVCQQTEGRTAMQSAAALVS